MRHIEAMLDVDLSDEGQRFEARDVIAPVVARWVGARGYDEVRAAFDAAGVCWWGPCQSFLEMVSDDPRCSTGNPLFEEVDQPGIGRFMMPGSPLEFRRHEREAVRPRSDARSAHRRDSRRGAGIHRRQDWRAAGRRSRRLILRAVGGSRTSANYPDGAGRSQGEDLRLLVRTEGADDPSDMVVLSLERAGHPVWHGAASLSSRQVRIEGRLPCPGVRGRRRLHLQSARKQRRCLLESLHWQSSLA